jgi:hypothetical protein
MGPGNRNICIGPGDAGVTARNIDAAEIKQIAETRHTNGAAIAPELGVGGPAS